MPVMELFEMPHPTKSTLPTGGVHKPIHRLSTIMKADHIHVLEQGKIVESGTREDLLALNGRFRQLYDMQYGNGTHE